MSTVRLRRLQSDYESIRRLVRLHPRIEIEGVQGNPPERYRLVILANSLRERAGRITAAGEHRLEIAFPQSYPRDAPSFRMLTPVFHPNIAPHAVCVGDQWTAGEPIDQLIQRVGEMLAYQSYNVKSPLNGKAAQWVEENAGAVPTDQAEFFIDLEAQPADAGVVPRVVCSNCAATDATFVRCAADHQLCDDCAMSCGTCGRILCLVCGIAVCADHPA